MQEANKQEILMEDKIGKKGLIIDPSYPFGSRIGQKEEDQPIH